jgi:hypothetical protein
LLLLFFFLNWWWNHHGHYQLQLRRLSWFFFFTLVSLLLLAPERKGWVFDDNESHRTKTLAGSFHLLLALHEDCSRGLIGREQLGKSRNFTIPLPSYVILNQAGPERCMMHDLNALRLAAAAVKVTTGKP